MRRLILTIVIVGNFVSAAAILLVFVLIEPAPGGAALKANQPHLPIAADPRAHYQEHGKLGFLEEREDALRAVKSATSYKA